jgi:uncharacterized oligopeptide transporter (OPT) family protein
MVRALSDEDPEQRWLREVYQPGARQLTVRAVVAGMLLGALMSLSNLYVVLKTGWSLGVTITACILAYAIFAALNAAGIMRSHFSMLENNAMGSVASAAGYMTGGGNMAAIPALLMLTDTRPNPWAMFIWFAVIAAMGVFAAIPIKRQLINVEQLPFPMGTATAETIRSLHTAGEKGTQQARWLGLAAVVGAVLAWMRDAKASWMAFNLPASFGFPFKIAGVAAKAYTLAYEGSLLLFGAGMLINFKTGWSMLVGGLVTYAWLAPMMVARGVITTVSYKGIVQWTLWGGASLLLTSGLLSFAFQWKMVARSFRELRGMFSRAPSADTDPMAHVECPPSWFPLGYLILSPVVVFLMWALFDIPIWAGLVAIPLSVLMGVVAARVTGETDTTPTKALGPVTQLVYGGLLPGNLTANVMGANVTAGAGLHAADLLTDLKSGFLLGANPRQQLFAQLFGVAAGAAMVVPAFNLLVPEAKLLGGEQFPAPGAQVWAGVSKVMIEGISGLHPTARWAALICGLIGIVLVLLERFLPKKVTRFIPSASGVGVAMVIPFYNSLSMFLGSLIAAILKATRPKLADKMVLPVASGFIAGESLMGILVAVLVAFGILAR